LFKFDDVKDFIKTIKERIKTEAHGSIFLDIKKTYNIIDDEAGDRLIK